MRRKRKCRPSEWRCHVTKLAKHPKFHFAAASTHIAYFATVAAEGRMLLTIISVGLLFSALVDLVKEE